MEVHFDLANLCDLDQDALAAYVAGLSPATRAALAIQAITVLRGQTALANRRAAELAVLRGEPDARARAAARW